MVKADSLRTSVVDYVVRTTKITRVQILSVRFTAAKGKGTFAFLSLLLHLSLPLSSPLDLAPLPHLSRTLSLHGRQRHVRLCGALQR